MKIIYYKQFITDRNDLSAAERIVFSFLISQSILNYESAFGYDGKKLSDDMICEILEERMGWCDLPNFFYDRKNNFCYGKKISKFTNVPLSATQYSLQTLQQKGYLDIDGKVIKVGEFIPRGYFELLTNKEHTLRGELRIFYSWLCDYFKLCGGYICANASAIAKSYNTTKENVKIMIHRLKSLNLLERDDDGKLKINPI